MIPSLPKLDRAKSYCLTVHNVPYGKKILESKISGNLNEVMFLEPKDNIGIDEVRQAIEFLESRSDRKIVVIYEADKMTQEAANAFLKTLEEPPEYATIILVTSRWSAMLPTIRSRVQRIFVPIQIGEKFDDFEKHILFWNYDYIERIESKSYTILSEEDLLNENADELDKIFTLKHLIEKYKDVSLDQYVKFISQISKVNDFSFLKLTAKVISWFIYNSNLNANNKLNYLRICDEIHKSKVANFNYQLTYYVLLLSIKEI
ncbi:MAG: hypothetical protein ACP5KD_06990 [Fervidobacterium sp.]